MPRSSRHKSHKQKHSSRDSRERSDSEEEEFLKERKRKEDSGIRVSDSAEKRESPLQSQKEKDGALDYSGLKRRKDRVDSAVTDRWNGGEDRRVEDLVPEKELKGEGFGSDSEKRMKAKVSVDSKSRSSRSLVLAVESEEVKKGSGRVESKRKLDKDSGRKDANEYKDTKEKEKEKEKERGVDRDRKGQDGKRERSVDIVMGITGGGSEMSRKQGARTSGSEEERHVRPEVEITEWQIQDDLRNPELEKELEKRIRRRDGSGDKDKRQEDVRDGEDRRLSSRDDHLQNGRYNDERSKDDKYRDKYRDDLDRGQRYRDDKHNDEHSRDRTIDRSDKSSESRHKKAKLQGSEHDGSPHVDDRGIRNKDIRGRKRSSENFEDHSDLNSQSTRDHNIDVEKSALRSTKLDSFTDKGRSKSHHHHSDVAVHSTPSNSLLKSSPSSSSHVVKDQYRHGSKQAESRDTFSEERYRSNTASTIEVVSDFGGANRVSESLSMDKQNHMDHNQLTELIMENAAGPQYGRSPKSAHQSSPIQSTEKSPSSTSGDRRYMNRTGLKRSLEGEEMGRRNSGFKDARDNSNKGRVLEVSRGKHPLYDLCQAELDGEAAPVCSTNRLASRSPSVPPPPSRHGINSPTVLGSSEEDSRVAADRKSNNCFRRSVDPIVGRGQGNAWKGVPSWPSPMANGFVPFQHGPPPGGFHSVMQQFPATPLFGVRPSMELSHSGVSYPMHDGDRFSGHTRPFGWRTPTDDSYPPHMHGWDGSNGVFGDETHIYGRPDLDQNRHLMNSRGWEMNADMWKGQNGNMMAELPASKNELEYSTHILSDDHRSGHASHRSQSGRTQPKCFPAGRIEVKKSDFTPAKITAEDPPRIVHEKTTKGSKISSSDSSDFCRTYLSMLDISVDLANPELYKQCTSLLEMEGTSNATKQIYPEDGIELVGSKNSNHILRDSIFPPITETLHQRAIDLYKKQKTQMKVKIPALSSDGSKVDKVSPASGEEKMVPVEDHSSLEHALASLANTEDDKDRTSSNSKGDLFGDAKKSLSNTVSDTVSSPVVFTDDSQAIEALMPESSECRVNLSRIHNPPESTH